MRIVDVIASKRDGGTLSQAEIDYFIAGLQTGDVPDYQASALMMAIFLRGMTAEETAWLAAAMVRSGDRVDLSDIPGIKVGKHSTGGVGDKVSIVLAPIAAACGVIVPKMSGRGLGHTGGTLDKLESIPGFRIDLSIDEFKRVLRTVGTSIIGQTTVLAPADKKLYALRDVTATIESIPLIAASIMSKKLAEGSNALVLDVKCGDGAFMKTRASARSLAEAMVAIGAHSGVRTEAIITSMDAPLGMAIGNSLEIVECLETLKRRGPASLTSVVRHLAARMVVLSGVEPDEVVALARVDAALSSGRALERFAAMITAQGGDAAVVDDYTRLPTAPSQQVVPAPHDGYVSTVHAEQVGRGSAVLGAGRERVSDPVDHAVGVVMHVKPGDAIRRGEPLLTLHHRERRGLDEALALCAQAVLITEDAPALLPHVLDEVRDQR
jgi:pyrimidine-nucleoside phosphorylase